MTKPQQPELRRSSLGSTDQEAAELRAGDVLGDSGPDDRGARGPVPEENRPGHRPAHDQDKPEGPPDERA